jgi:hypothetical protein
MQMDNIRALFAGKNPFGRGGTIESERVRVTGKWPSCIILVIDSAAAVLCKQCVIKNDVLHAAVVNWDVPDIYGSCAAAKVDVDCRQVDGTRKLVQCAIRWRCNRRMPARSGQSERQVTHDIANAADFAAGQGAGLGCKENDSPRIDNGWPTA